MSWLVTIGTSGLGPVGLVRPDGVDSSSAIRSVVTGRSIGNDVDVNSYDPDGYRWHDAFHLANLTILGGSPVMRAPLKRKRRSNPSVDNVEDGGRAIPVEEGISALIFW